MQLKSSLLPVGDWGEREVNYVSFSGSGAPLLSSIDNVVQMSSYVLFSNAVQMFANVVQMYSCAPVQMFYSLVLVHSPPVLSPSVFFVTRSRSCVYILEVGCCEANVLQMHIMYYCSLVPVHSSPVLCKCCAKSSLRAVGGRPRVRREENIAAHLHIWYITYFLSFHRFTCLSPIFSASSTWI